MNNIDKNGIIYWCDSVEKTFNPREDIPDGEKSKEISERFLATAIRYLRATCAELIDNND